MIAFFVYKKIENGVENELLGLALTKLNDKERKIMKLRYEKEHEVLAQVSNI